MGNCFTSKKEREDEEFDQDGSRLRSASSFDTPYQARESDASDGSSPTFTDVSTLPSRHRALPNPAPQPFPSCPRGGRSPHIQPAPLHPKRSIFTVHSADFLPARSTAVLGTQGLAPERTPRDEDSASTGLVTGQEAYRAVETEAEVSRVRPPRTAFDC